MPRPYSQQRSWTGAEQRQAALGAGRVRDIGPTLYDDLTDDEIQAEYALACEWDATSARELEARFPWLLEAKPGR